MQRRFAGICKHHRIDFDRARKNLVFSSGEFQRLVLAIMRGGMVEVLIGGSATSSRSSKDTA